jgi:hypothetical protein
VRQRLITEREAPGVILPRNEKIRPRVRRGRKVLDVSDPDRADTVDRFGEAMTNFRVRPYSRTGGRTRSAITLDIETIVSTNERAARDPMTSTAEHRTITSLCRNPHSVAEVSARLRLPLGVVRVLLADMSDLSLITVHQNAGIQDNRPTLELMERVLAGLRSI